MSHVLEKKRAVGLTLRPSNVLKSPQLEPHPAYPAFHSSCTASSLTPHLCSPLCSFHRSMTVTLGAHNITAKEETQQIIPVAKAIPHPDYNATAFFSDIMLLKVRPVTFATTNPCPLAVLFLVQGEPPPPFLIQVLLLSLPS